MLHIYNELDVDDFVGDDASVAIRGEPMEVAWVAHGLFGSNAVRAVANLYKVDNGMVRDSIPYHYDNGMIPSPTMFVANIMLTDPYGHQFIQSWRYDWRMYGVEGGFAELFVEASVDEIHYLVSVLTTD